MITIKNYNRVLLFILFSLTSLTINAANYYWVGGAGDWHDYANHWATTSGGTTMRSQAPQSTDDVFFDANSGFLNNDKVTHTNSASAVCRDMTWSTNVPGVGLSASGTSRNLDIYGSLTFESGMGMTGYTGALRFYSNTTETITWNNVATAFYYVRFEPQGGTFTVVDDFRLYVNTTGRSRMYINPGSGGSVTFQDTVWTGNLYDGIYVQSGTATFEDWVTKGGGSPANSLGYFRSTGGTANFNHDFNCREFRVEGGQVNIVGQTCSLESVISKSSTLATNVFNMTNSTITTRNWDFRYISGSNLTSDGSVLVLERSGATSRPVFLGRSGQLYNVVYAKKAQMEGGNSSCHIDSLIVTAESYSSQISRTFNIGSLLQFSTGIHSGGATINISDTSRAAILGECYDYVYLSNYTFNFNAFTTGSLYADYVDLNNVTATGPATPYNIGSNSIIGNGSTGWTTGSIITPRVLHWQGPIATAGDYSNYGHWHDTANWSVAGGVPGSPIGSNCPPTLYDSVVFPANSYVRINNPVATCKSMNWLGTGELYDSAPAGVKQLHIYGSLHFSASMTNNFAGLVYFRAWEKYPTITSNGNQFNHNVYFNATSDTGTWHLLDSFAVPGHRFGLYKGNFHTSGHPVTMFNYYAGGNPIRVHLYNSDIWVIGRVADGRTWRSNDGEPTLIQYPGTSHIHLTYSGTSEYLFDFEGTLDFYDVTFSAKNPTIRRVSSTGGIGTWHNLTFEHGGTFGTRWASGSPVDSIHKLEVGTKSDAYTFTLSTLGDFVIDTAYYRISSNIKNDVTYRHLMKLFPGKNYDFAPNASSTGTQTFASAGVLEANGNCLNPIGIANGSFYSTGSQSGDYLNLSDNTASGATFSYTNSILSNTTGWTGTPGVPRKLYWIDTTSGVSSGQWNDMNSWTLTDGIHDGGNCPPSSIDTVVFTNSSFSGNDSVIIDLSGGVYAACSDMLWQTTATTPVFYGTSAQELRVFGSLEFAPSMDMQFDGHVHFKGSRMHTITTNDNPFIDEVYFDGTGTWTLQDSFNQHFCPAYNQDQWGVNLLSGTLNTNGQGVRVGGFLVSGPSSDSAILNLGTSNLWLSCPRSWYDDLYVNGTSNLRIEATFSTVYGANGTRFYDRVSRTNKSWGRFVAGNFYNQTQVRCSDCTFEEILSLGELNLVNGNMHIKKLIGEHPSEILYVSGDGNTIDTARFKGPAILSGDNYFTAELSLTAAKTYVFGAGKYQHLANACALDMVGLAGQEIQLYSSSTGSIAYIRKDSGYACTNYIYLRDIHAIGDGTSTNGGCTIPDCDTIVNDAYVPSLETSGRAAFMAGTNANNQGNVAGWEFTNFVGTPVLNLLDNGKKVSFQDSGLVSFNIKASFPVTISYRKINYLSGGIINIDTMLYRNDVTVSVANPLDTTYNWQYWDKDVVNVKFEAVYLATSGCFNFVPDISGVESFVLGGILSVIDVNSIYQDSTIEGNILSNDKLRYPGTSKLILTAIDGNAVSGATSITTPKGGTLSIDSTGVFTYTPANGFTGVDSMVYEVCDTTAPLSCQNQIAVFNVLPSPDPSDSSTNTVIANPDKIVSTGKKEGINLLSNDADPEWDSITFNGVYNGSTYVNNTTITSVAGYDKQGNPVSNAGDLNISPNGDVSFTPAQGFIGSATVSYKICDNGSPQACMTSILDIQVEDTLSSPIELHDNAPIANDDFVATDMNVKVEGNYIDNDIDLDTSDAFAVNGVLIDPTGPATVIQTLTTDNGGTVKIKSDGTYAYTPPSGFSGYDKVSYQLCDTSVTIQCTEGKISMLVAPVVRDYSEFPVNMFPLIYSRFLDGNSNTSSGFAPFWLGSHISDETSVLSNDTLAISDAFDDGLIFNNVLDSNRANTFYAIVNSSKPGLKIHVKLMMDWDNDGVFDSSLFGVGVTSSPDTIPMDVYTPPGFQGGPVNMRLIAQLDPSSFGNSVLSGGEVEDYRTLFPTPLPVDLVDFKVTKSGDLAILDWSTAMEVNNSHFNILRMVDVEGRFIKIGEVSGAGNSNERLLYSYSDDLSNVIGSTVYYRLEQVDFNGTSKLSSIRRLEISNMLEVGEVLVFPNPATKEITLRVKDYRGIFVYSLVNSLGQKVLTGESSNGLKIDVSNLSKGVYYLNIGRMDKLATGRKIVIMD